MYVFVSYARSILYGITFQPFGTLTVEADACSAGESYHLVNFDALS